QADRLMQIRAAHRNAFVTSRLALADHVGEQIAERRRRFAAHTDREVESFESEGGRVAGTHEAHGVVVPAAIGVDQRLVRLGDLTNLRRRHPITRIDVRMKLPRQALVGPLDIADAGAPFQAKHDIEVHDLAPSPEARAPTAHDLPSSTTSASMTSPVGRPAPVDPPAAPPPAPAPLSPAPGAPGPPGACCR